MSSTTASRLRGGSRRPQSPRRLLGVSGRTAFASCHWFALRSSSRRELALVTGFLADHERWQDGAAREVREESGVIIAAAKLEH